jgi:hypothetical protein
VPGSGATGAGPDVTVDGAAGAALLTDGEPACIPMPIRALIIINIVFSFTTRTKNTAIMSNSSFAAQAVANGCRTIAQPSSRAWAGLSS